jgi:hypothetical protein
VLRVELVEPPQHCGTMGFDFDRVSKRGVCGRRQAPIPQGLQRLDLSASRLSVTRRLFT